MRLVDIEHVSRSYGRIQALSDVSLQLDPGTIGLVGNNGAGKSTLLRILLGLLKPDAGGGTILGCDILRGSSRLRGQVGYMPETAATVPLLKGAEFVTLSGDLYGMPHRDARRRAHEVLTYVGLGELRYRRLDEYSTGNLQRLKLAAALVHDPQLLLLDEPTNGLDPQGRADMLKLIRDLIAETGKSVILCTHLLSDVERLCQTVVVLHQGQVIKSGPLAELRRGALDRYELDCVGDREAYYAALGRAGVRLPPGRNGAKTVVSVPPAWPAARFFQIAQEAGASLCHLKLLEEDLQGLFFRVTDEHAANGTPAAEAADG
jgi:ABC-2 type transport system ATP-binding protein